MREEREEIIRGLKVDQKDQLPIQISSAICFGCILGFGLIYLIGILSIWLTK